MTAYPPYRAESRIIVWEVNKGRVSDSFKTGGSFIPFSSGVPFPMVWSLAFSPGGRLIADGFGNLLPMRPAVKVIDTRSGKEISSLVRSPASTIGVAVAFSPSRVLAVSTISFVGLVPVRSSLAAWDVERSRRLRRYKGCGFVAPFAFSPDGKTLAGGSGRKVCLWDVRSGEKYAPISLRRPLDALTFTKQGSLKWVEARQGGVHVWDLDKWKEVGHCAVPIVYGLAQFSSDGKLLAWEDSRNKGEIRLWDTEVCAEIHTFSMERATKKKAHRR